MKKIICLSVTLSLFLTVCSACSEADKTKSAKKEIVVTNFAEYDWVRSIVGSDDVFEITMLGGGVDLHSYQPSAADIITITDCDIFVYVGGESDKWVGDVLGGQHNENMEILNLIDILGENVRTEEHIEGMQEEHSHDEEEDNEEEFDEHVWLSLKNSMIFCDSIEAVLEKLDPDNKDVYKNNLDNYKEKLADLDNRYSETAGNAKRNVLLFGDRFPFRYMTEDYDLEYYAVFSGCSAETEASFETITFMAKKIDELSLNCVMTIEGSDKKLAKTIIENTKTKSQEILTLNSMQSVTLTDIEGGESYLQVMEDNLSVLTKALN